MFDYYEEYDDNGKKRRRRRRRRAFAWWCCCGLGLFFLLGLLAVVISVPLVTRNRFIAPIQNESSSLCECTSPERKFTYVEPDVSYIAYHNNIARVAATNESLQYIPVSSVASGPGPNLCGSGGYPTPTYGGYQPCTCNSIGFERSFNSATDGTNGEHGIAYDPNTNLLYRTTGYQPGNAISSAGEVLQTINPITLITGPNLAPGNAYPFVPFFGPSQGISGLLYYPPTNELFAVKSQGNGDHYFYSMQLNGASATYLGTRNIPGFKIRGLALVNGTRIFGVSNIGNNLYELNPTNGTVIRNIQMTLPPGGGTLFSANAITTNPISGDVVVAYQNSNTGNARQLGIVDIDTGKVLPICCPTPSIVSVSAMVFDNTGKLWILNGGSQTSPLPRMSLFSLPQEPCSFLLNATFTTIAPIAFYPPNTNFLIGQGTLLGDLAPDCSVINTIGVLDSVLKSMLVDTSDNNRVFGISDYLLKEINPLNGNFISSQYLRYASAFLTSGSIDCIAWNPKTNTAFIVFQDPSNSTLSRLIGILSLNNGTVEPTCMAPMTNNIVSMTFDNNGHLYLNTGTLGTEPLSLLELTAEPCGASSPAVEPYVCNCSESAPTLFKNWTYNDEGEALGYNPNNNTIVHLTGFQPPFQSAESLDLNTLALTTLVPPAAGFGPGTIQEIQAFTYYPPWNRYVAFEYLANGNRFFSVSLDCLSWIFMGNYQSTQPPLSPSATGYKGLAVVDGNRLFGVDAQGGYLFEFNPTSGYWMSAPILMRRSTDLASVRGANGLATNPITGEVMILYRMTTGTSVRQLGIVDVNTGIVTPTCANLTSSFGALTFDNQGNLYLGAGNQNPVRGLYRFSNKLCATT